MRQSKAYLTIDDSPSDRMDDLVDYLVGKGVPALFFCRGDKLEENAEQAIRAIQKGFVLANHAWSHQRSSQKDFDWIVQDIEKTERKLETLYAAAGVQKQGRYFRFPQLDRGTAGWIVDYDAYGAHDRQALLTAFAEGLNVESMDKPADAAWQKKDRLQTYLKEAGYNQPFKDVTHAWFAKGEIAEASDCLYTYSNCDWMLTVRHQGRWPYKSLEDLKARAAADPWLNEAGSVNVVLAHDQAEVVDITVKLIDDLLEKGLKFIEV